MDLRQLESLAAVLDTGSFTAAARRRHLTQPALWAQVRGLEDELGVRLFTKVGRGVVPTAACLALRGALRATLGDARAFVALAAEIRAGKAAPARIGCARYHVPAFLAGCIARLQEQDPAAPFPQIVSVSSGTAPALLARGELDLVVLPGGPIPGGEGFRLYPVWVAVLGPLATTRLLPVRALAGGPLATLPPESAVRATLERAAAAAGVPLRIVHEDADVHTLLALAARKLCTAVVVSEALGDEDAARAAVLVGDDGPFVGDLWLSWRSEEALSPAARTLRDVMRAEQPAADARVASLHGHR